MLSLHGISIIFKSGDCSFHSKTFIHLSWRYFMVDFEVCFVSLSCWMIPLFNFNVWTVLWTLTSGMSWYLLESILPSHSHNISCGPSCHINTKHNWSTTMLHSWQGVLLYKDFTLFSPNKHLVVGKKFKWVFVSCIVSQGLRLNVFSCILQKLNFVLRLFFLATLRCRPLLFIYTLLYCE